MPLKVFLSSFYGELKVESKGDNLYNVKIMKKGRMVKVELDSLVPVVEGA